MEIMWKKIIVVIGVFLSFVVDVAWPQQHT